MANFTLDNPTDQSRAGSTLSWANIADVLDPVLYADTSPYNPGVSADYIALTIAAPSPPLAALPATLTLTLRGYVAPVTGTTPAWVVDDTVSLTVAGSQVGADAAQNLPWTTTPSVRTWSFSTAGISGLLAAINAGTAGVLLGFSAPGSNSQFVSGDWTISYSASGSKVVSGGTPAAWTSGPGPFSGATGNLPTPCSLKESGSITVFATWIGVGGAPVYVPLNLSSPVSAEAIALDSFPPSSSVCETTVTDAFGNSSTSGPGFTPQQSNTSHTVKTNLAVSGGVASFTGTLLAEAISTYSPLNQGGDQASVNLTGAVTTPDPATLYLDQAALSYVASGSGGGGGSGPSGGGNTGNFMFSPRINVFPPEAATIL